MRTFFGRAASSRNRLSDRIREWRLRILPFVFGKTRPESAQEAAAILSSSCLARCALSTSTVRGPMRILRSLPVLVVETRVFVRVSAERLTVMKGLSVRSKSSHLRAASSPWRIPVLSARVSRASSRVPTAAPKTRSLFLGQRLTGDCSRLAAFFTRLAGWTGLSRRPHSLVELGRENPLHHADGVGVQPLFDLPSLKGAHVSRCEFAEPQTSEERH